MGIAVMIAISASADDQIKAKESDSDAANWQQDFNLNRRTLVTSGENSFFVLKPGFQLVLENGKNKLQITVLDETNQIGTTTTRVVEEREWRNGEIVEVSRNFFAIDKSTNDVFYFGEEVDEYKNGKVTAHSGSWRADETGAKAGLIMPGTPKVGQKFYQELSPRKAMDRAEVLSLTERLKTPAGAFENCLKTKEGSGLNPAEKEFKTYAPGIGIIQDEDLLLTKSGYIEAP
jgi:hypothetical protein